MYLNVTMFPTTTGRLSDTFVPELPVRTTPVAPAPASIRMFVVLLPELVFHDMAVMVPASGLMNLYPAVKLFELGLEVAFPLNFK